MTAEYVLALCLFVFVIAFLWGEHDGRQRERSHRLRRRVKRYSYPYPSRKDW